MFITTLPSANKLDLVDRMYSNPLVDGARYNVGIRTSYSPGDALRNVKQISDKYGKKLWLDLKGRQLRITKWADPTYGNIELNHAFEVDLPAKIIFRGDDVSNVIDVKGNRIFIDPDPRSALGAGQAINILGSNFRVTDGYLTDEDCKYIEAAKKLGMHDYMLSFAECREDIDVVRSIDPNARVILKIESQKGLEYVAKGYSSGHDGNLMAARDDLMINIGDNKFNMIKALELIVERDMNAVAASHLFTSFSIQGFLSMADISDLVLLKKMGYKNFMLSDGISHKHFDAAMDAWRSQSELYGF